MSETIKNSGPDYSSNGWVLKRDHFLKRRYLEIARQSYSQEELDLKVEGDEAKETGWKGGCNGEYVFISSNKKRGLELIFKKREDGFYGIARENLEILFEESEDPVGDFSELISIIMNASTLDPILSGEEYSRLKLIKRILKDALEDKEKYKKLAENNSRGVLPQII